MSKLKIEKKDYNIKKDIFEVEDDYGNRMPFDFEELMEIYYYAEENLIPKRPDMPVTYNDTELCSCEYCTGEQNICLDDETGLMIKKSDEDYIVTDMLGQTSSFTREEMFVISDYILGDNEDFENEEFNCETCPERFNCEEYEDDNDYVEIIIKRKDLNKILFND